MMTIVTSYMYIFVSINFPAPNDLSTLTTWSSEACQQEKEGFDNGKTLNKSNKQNLYFDLWLPKRTLV